VVILTVMDDPSVADPHAAPVGVMGYNLSTGDIGSTGVPVVGSDRLRPGVVTLSVLRSQRGPVRALMTKEEQMRSLKGRVALITGASRGIGHAMALAFG
jgi:hypothetical protein